MKTSKMYSKLILHVTVHEKLHVHVWPIWMTHITGEATHQVMHLSVILSKSPAKNPEDIVVYLKKSSKRICIYSLPTVLAENNNMYQSVAN